MRLLRQDAWPCPLSGAPLCTSAGQNAKRPCLSHPIPPHGLGRPRNRRRPPASMIWPFLRWQNTAVKADMW